MNILLIQPPVRDFYYTPMRSFPLGICSVAAYLTKEGHQVAILDCVRGGTRTRAVQQDSDFSYLEAFYQKEHISPFGLFNTLKHYGYSFDEIAGIISKHQADIVGISMMMSAYADEAIRVAEIVKAHHPKSIVVAGGAHAHSYAEELLTSHRAIDFIVRGEGERAFSELLRNLECPARVSGLAYRENGRVHVTEPAHEEKLDTYPWPARELLNPDDYVIGKKRYTPIVTSRGCPLHCGFCSIGRFMGTQFRTRAIDDVCDEIIHCYDEFGVRIFDIEDDNFTYDKNRAAHLLSQIKSSLGKRAIEITAMNGLYYETLSDELLELLHEAGMRRLNISLVSNADSATRAFSRALDSEHFKKVVIAARKRAMHVTAYCIIGLPGETIETMLKTVHFLAELPVLIGPSVYYHVPDSALFTVLCREGKASKKDYRYFRSTAFWYQDENFSREDLVTIFRITRMINFMKSNEGTKTDAVFMQTETGIRVSHALTHEELGTILFQKFLREKCFYSFKKVKRHDSAAVEYQFIKDACSQKVIDMFFSMFSTLLRS